MQYTDQIYWIGASQLPSALVRKFLLALSYFKTPQNFFLADPQVLTQHNFLCKDLARIKQIDWQSALKIQNVCEENQIQIITQQDVRYPSCLLEIFDAPLLLYVKGNLDVLNFPSMAMVGTRHPSCFGSEQAFQFAHSLEQLGFTINSGLAIGIDGASHRGALKGDGKTCAILGTGLLSIYPKQHIALAQEIQARGLLISEFAPLMGPRKDHFPRRNRIISGLSLGVLVIEAALKSGSLITARLGMEQGREVYAMPGSIQQTTSRGCHWLIRQGATLVSCVQDITDELCLTSSASMIPDRKIAENLRQKLTEQQREMLYFVDHSVTSVDTIIMRSGLTAAEVSSMLLQLELKNCVKVVPGGIVKLL